MFAFKSRTHRGFTVIHTRVWQELRLTFLGRTASCPNTTYSLLTLPVSRRGTLSYCVFYSWARIHSQPWLTALRSLGVGRRSASLLLVPALCNTAREALLLWPPWYLALGIHTHCCPTSPGRLISEANTLLPAWVPAVHTGIHPSLLSLLGASIPRSAVPSWGQCSHQA